MTQAQIEYIKSMGGTPPAYPTKGEASRVIDALILQGAGRITPRQHMYLRFWGKQPEPGWGKMEVMKWMDAHRDEAHEKAWAIFKDNHPEVNASNKPDGVPFGAGANYLAKVNGVTAKPQGAGCLIILLPFVGLTIWLTA
ncbi:MAG: hypothetical protein RL077_329 [Verrucomicrobiota bacterium]|jgi:hypothetical protein